MQDQVTSQLTVSQSVCLAIEPLLGLFSFNLNLQRLLWLHLCWVILSELIIGDPELHQLDKVKLTLCLSTVK